MRLRSGKSTVGGGGGGGRAQGQGPGFFLSDIDTVTFVETTTTTPKKRPLPATTDDDNDLQLEVKRPAKREKQSKCNDVHLVTLPSSPARTRSWRTRQCLPESPNPLPLEVTSVQDDDENNDRDYLVTQRPSGSNLVTGLPGSSEAIKGPFSSPFLLFPEEMWLKAFGMGMVCGDLETVINTCPQWRSLLQSKRVNFLFPQVIRLLIDKANPSWAKEQQLTNQDLLGLKNVCSSWHNEFLQFIQNHPSHFHLPTFSEDELFENDKPCFKWDGTGLQKCFDAGWFQDFERISKRYPTYYKKGSNILFTKHLIITETNTTEERQGQGQGQNNRDNENREPEDDDNVMFLVFALFTGMIAFIKRYGPHIWHLNLNVKKTPLILLYSTLRIWLRKIPNLKSLTFSYDAEGVLLRGRQARRALGPEDVRRDVLAHVPRDIRDEPLQSDMLKNVKMLNLENIPAPIATHFMKQCKNLERVKINYTSKLLDNVVFTFKHNPASPILPNVTELMIRLRSFKDWVDWEFSLFAIGAKLQKLFLLCSEETEDGQNPGFRQCPDWHRIFKMLRKRFGETLTDLKLYLPKATRPLDQEMITVRCPKYRLVLPKLTKLRVFMPNVCTIDFILSLAKTLEAFEVILLHSQHAVATPPPATMPKIKEVIQFQGFENRMLESNIWKKMPKLEVIRIHALLHDGANPKEASSFARFSYNRPS